MTIITSNQPENHPVFTKIESFLTRFSFSKIAYATSAKKEKGVSFIVLFAYVLSTVFSNRSLYRDRLLNDAQLNFSDKTVRNMLNNGKTNWQCLLILISKAVIDVIRPLTNDNRQEVFIIDDSMYERLFTKRLELCAWQCDHADSNKKKLGFRFLQLGWSDGNSFIPVNFSLLSGTNKIKEATLHDNRTLSSRRKNQAQRKGTDVALELKEALKNDVRADYVLFDSWFSSPSMFHAVRTLNLHAVAMIKRCKKVHYTFNDKQMDVKSIFKQEKKRRGRSRYLLSVVVECTKNNVTIPIKLVFVRNRNNRKDYLVLASTNTELNEEKIIQLYGKRWAIEVYFKTCKQYLRLSKYQGISYDGIFAHTTLVCISYVILAVQHREQTNDRTMGGLFYLMVQELSDVSFYEAISFLLSLFEDVLNNEPVISQDKVDEILNQFIELLPMHFREVFLKK